MSRFEGNCQNIRNSSFIISYMATISSFLFWIVHSTYYLILPPLSLRLVDWSYWAQIITAFSVAVAVATYYREKERSRLESVAKQIHLFRTDVMDLGRDSAAIVNDIQARIKRELAPIESVQEFSIKWLLTNRTVETLKQQAFWVKAEDPVAKNQAAPIINLLNALEELSVDILAQKVSDSPQLVSIQYAFISYVELYAWKMVMISPYNPAMYPAVKELYFKWKDQIDRMPLDKIKQKVEDDIDAASKTMLSNMSPGEYRALMEE